MCTTQRLTSAVEQLANAPHREERHGEIRLSGKLDEFRVKIELTCLPGEVIGVYRNTLPSNSRARIERHEATRFRRRGIDDFPHVEVHTVAEHRELVHERDVQGAEWLLEKLRELGDVSGR